MMEDHPSVRGAAPRLRVVVETDDPAALISDFSGYTDAGIEVLRCAGPGRDASQCPMVRGERCGLVDGADAVLCDLSPGATRDAVVAAMRRGAPSVPLVVVMVDPNADVPSGCEALPVTTSVSGQVRVLRRAAISGADAQRRHSLR